MKTRLAKKIASRPLDKLPHSWLMKLYEGKDRRIAEAIKLHERLITKQKTYEQ